MISDGVVRQAVYRNLIDRRRACTRRELAVQLGVPLPEIAASFERMHEQHVLVLDRCTREVRMAMPFSAVPTAFTVQIGDRSWWANCIEDALGVVAVLSQDAVIRTSCPVTGDPLTIEVDADQGPRTPGTVHFSVPARLWWADIEFT